MKFSACKSIKNSCACELCNTNRFSNGNLTYYFYIMDDCINVMAHNVYSRKDVIHQNLPLLYSHKTRFTCDNVRRNSRKVI